MTAGGLRYLCTRSFEVACVGDGLLVEIEWAVINIEAAAQTETPVEYETAHERGCMITGIFQYGRNRFSRPKGIPLSSTPLANGYVDVSIAT